MKRMFHRATSPAPAPAAVPAPLKPRCSLPGSDPKESPARRAFKLPVRFAVSRFTVPILSPAQLCAWPTLITGLLTLLLNPASAATPATLPGLALGAKAPPFTLKNAQGTDIALDQLLKKGPVALVFYRSADW